MMEIAKISLLSNLTLCCSNSSICLLLPNVLKALFTLDNLFLNIKPFFPVKFEKITPFQNCPFE